MDEVEFARIAEQHHARLMAHCYRMLGSVHDAEDAVQETMVRAWRGLPGFAGRSSVTAWLYRIATNVSLDAIARRPKRVVSFDVAPAADPRGGRAAPLTETAWLEPFPDAVLDGEPDPAGRFEQRESVELAFTAALQHLPGRQRAALVLRDVLGYSAQETAQMLDSTVAAANGHLRRARKTVRERLPGPSQQESLRGIGDAELERLVASYMRAWEAADVDRLLELLTEDATLTMPPAPTWLSGRDAIGAFLPIGPFSGAYRGVRLVPARASAQPALAAYRAGELFALHILSVRDGLVSAIDGFTDPSLFASLGLPERL